MKGPLKRRWLEGMMAPQPSPDNRSCHYLANVGQGGMMKNLKEEEEETMNIKDETKINLVESRKMSYLANMLKSNYYLVKRQVIHLFYIFMY